MSQLNDYYFWFAQPSSILSNADKYLAYLFAGFLVLAIILGLLTRFTKNSVNAKLLKRFFSLSLTTALSGLAWVGLRYENVPLLGRRYWAAITLLIALVWFVWIMKYVIFGYTKDKTEFEKELIKSKYLPRK